MKEISIRKAEGELARRVTALPVEDAVYELAYNLVGEKIAEIENEFYVVDADGLPCMSDSGSDEMWYDDIREVMIQEVYAKVASFIKAQ